MMQSYLSHLTMFTSATLYWHFLEQLLALQGCSEFLNKVELVVSLGAAFQTNFLKIRGVKVSAVVDTPSPIACRSSLLLPPEPYASFFPHTFKGPECCMRVLMYTGICDSWCLPGTLFQHIK